MTDTTATARAEILEYEKQKIQAAIESLHELREMYYDIERNDLGDRVDKQIDELLAQKDNLSLSVPNGWIELAEESAEWDRERNDLYEMGMGR